VKLPRFAYARPRGLDEALQLLAEYGEDARPLAGGQSLLPAMAMRLVSPGIVVDIGGLGELRGISVGEDGWLRLGALTRHRELATDPLVARHAPLLREAASLIAHEAIRSRGTLGGSLALADPAAELPACCVALDARLVVTGPRGERRVAATDFFRGLYETVLEPGELLTAVEIPPPLPGRRTTILEVARRAGDYAMTGICLAVGRNGEVLRDVRIVFFAVADRPVVAEGAAAVIEGVPDTPETRRRALEALRGELRPMGDLHASAACKLHLAGVLLGRALDRLKGAEPAT